MQGIINDYLEPIIELGLFDNEEKIVKITAVVDTGFSGYICLSEKHIDDIAISYEYAESYELANGKIIIKDVFEGNIFFNGNREKVKIIFTESQDTLVGAQLLKKLTVKLNYPKKIIEFIK